MQKQIKKSFQPDQSVSLQARGMMLQRKCASCSDHIVDAGKCEECKKTEGLLQQTSKGQPELSEVPPIIHEALNTPEWLIDTGTLAIPERGFGHDLSKVRTQNDALLKMQPNPTINKFGDHYRQDADRIAGAVTWLTDSGTLRHTPPSIQRLATGQASSDLAPPIVRDVLSSPGQQLDVTTRAFFEPKFGHDFSQIRLHTGGKAEESARAINAVAYTLGNDVVWGKDPSILSTWQGLKILAHELAHTIQQRHSNQDVAPLSPKTLGPQNDDLEQEAEATSELVMWGWPARPVRTQLSAAPLRIQRQSNNEAAGGCGVCLSPTLAGTAAHFVVQQLFKLAYPSINTEAPFINPGDAENGRLDFLRIINSPTGVTEIEIGELKPDNDKGREAGKKDLLFYFEEVTKAFPGPLFAVGFLDLPAPLVSLPFVDPTGPRCPSQEIMVRNIKLGGQEGLYLYSCTPPRSKISSQCCKQAPVTIPASYTAPSARKIVVLVFDFVKQVIQTGEDVDAAARDFLQKHPEVAGFILVAGVVVVLALLADDLAGGFLDDAAIPPIILALWRVAQSLK